MSKAPEDKGALRKAPPRSKSTLTRDLSRVEEANFAFYEAFTRKDIEAMGRLWSASPYARCIHPGWEPVIGWPDIRESWLDIFNSISEISFELTEIHIEVMGQVAWVNLIAFAAVDTAEEGEFETAVVTTTIFEESDGEWRVALHHGSHYIDDEELDDDDLVLSALGRGGNPGSSEPN